MIMFEILMLIIGCGIGFLIGLTLGFAFIKLFRVIFDWGTQMTQNKGFQWAPYEKVDDVTRFTEGDCHLLARAIHRHTGWTFCTFEYKGSPDAHAFVQRPDGLYVDVEGVVDEDALLNKWGSNCKIKRWHDFTTFSENWPWWGGDFCTFGLYSYLRADQLARKIAACSFA